jgi:methionyl-tRNA synthetase
MVAGTGDLVVDGKRHRVGPAMVIQFEPFETHYLENTGGEDIVFATFYWRDADRAAGKAGGVQRRFHERPVFVFSSAPTPNGDLHLGHLSGPFFGADVYVRFQRMNGVNAYHISGSDDYQSYVIAAGMREGKSPAETAAHYSKEILETFKLMDIDVHQYTVTSQDPEYPQALRGFFSRLVDSGKVVLEEGRALFDGANGGYLYEVDVSGGCPTCGSQTGGNICEGCREPNFCVDLTSPRATFSEASPVEGSISRYTLKMLELADEVAGHHRLGRIPAGVKELADRLMRRDSLDVAVTHPSSWGIAPSEPGVPGQMIWVWIDLAFNFLHSIEMLGRSEGRAWRADDPSAEWKIVHFLGSDGTFYHPIMFPAMYRAAYPRWTPDIDYNINEFYLLDGSKFSTSRRHAIWGKEVLNPQTVDSFRFYLALTRPEGRRTNFERQAYQAYHSDVLIGRWQRWLNDLGSRVEKNFAGVAPDAGIWTPEHTAFLARLDNRLAAVTGALGQDGFSLNQAAAALNGIIDDVIAFCERENALADLAGWRDEARTAIALELAAAKLLAQCSAPVMPRFAARLAAALGAPEAIAAWPRSATLVTPGSCIDLAREVFFGEPRDEWFADLVRETLRLPADEEVHGKTLLELGLESMQAIALQYQILERTGADITVEQLLGEHTVDALATMVEEQA